MNFVFWTNQLAIHQSAFIRAVTNLGWSTTVVVAEAVSQDRQALGWNVPDFGSSRIIQNPDFHTINNLLEHDSANTVHLFGTIYDYSWGWYALFRAAHLKNRIGLMAEASDPDGLKVVLRWLKAVVIRTLIGGNIQFILAMGNLGTRWFRKCGYSDQKVFPFGYFLEQTQEIHKQNIADADQKKEGFHLVFIGQLVQRKRVDLLLKALSLLPAGPVHLTIFGDGPLRFDLQKFAQDLKVDQKITWQGIVPNNEISYRISNADLLVLPSRFDGWGAVINDALMAGVPVICTDYCGASELLLEDWRGEVVPRNNEFLLAKAILRFIDRGRIHEEMRQHIKKWANCISGESAAYYLQAVLDHVYKNGLRPTPPWR
jgi:glycosyltransferase involved in cell wall biosynthesis